MNSRSVLTVILAIIVILGGLAGTSQAEEADFYVSPRGRDSWSGTLPKPNEAGTDGPFETVTAARDAVRELKARGALEAPVTVMLRGGTYHLAEALVFEPRDSGAEKTPITYAAYPGEKPVLSGGRPINGWQRAEGKLWKTHIPAVQKGEWDFRQLFVNAERRHRARVPNRDEGFCHLQGLVKPQQRRDPINRRAFHFKPGHIDPDWTNLHDVEIVKLFGWDECRRPIQNVDTEKHICTVAGLCSRGNRRPFDWYGRRYWVENVFEELDTPGEWYLNRDTGNLHYWPRSDENMKAAKVIAPVTDEILRLAGRPEQGKFVHDLTFEGLTFAHCGAAFPEDGYPERQSEVFVPGAVRWTGARNCKFTGNELVHLGTYAIELDDGCQNNEIVRNRLHDLGAGGIKLGQQHEPKKDANVTGHITVADNRIYDGGHIYLMGAGIWAGHSGHNTIIHNSVHHLYGMGISIGWTWRYVLTEARDNEVAYNHIHHLGLGLLGSSSGIYTLARQPGTVIHHNLIHDLERNIDGPHHQTFGIQVDNGSGEIVYRENVIYNVPDACYKQFGKKHLVENNIFAFCDNYQILRRSDEGSLTFVKNIVYFDNGKLFGDSWEKQNFTVDSNCYWNTGDGPIDFAGQTWKKWRAKGHDKNSAIADPLFKDPESGDFRLRPGSPALDVGFEPIDLSTIGPR